MAEISPAAVKALREDTGLGMMDCKKALEEAKGDIEAAKDLLRKKGLATAEKKAGRSTGQGLVAITRSKDGLSAGMVEVQCETDFCARNDEFRKMVNKLAELTLQGGDGEVKATPAMDEALKAALAKIGENMKFANGRKITAKKIGTYVHFNGKVGVVIGLDGAIDDTLLSDLCMHVAFANPIGISGKDIPADVIAREKDIAKDKAIQSGKKPEIAEKMVDGAIRKFLEANALLEQPFVKDEKKKVKDLLGTTNITAFARFAVGG
ncbi:MAG: translation elongation factor Ts [Planctomycetes bacterium]|nr:translation elongation factor Ts [Planctomycetota bacterium]